MGPERRRHRPQRMCVQCRNKGDKDGFFRIAGRPGEGWEPDPRGTRPGRGIYLCRDMGCVEEFTKKIGTKKGAARWKMGGSAEVLVQYLEACRAGSGRPDVRSVKPLGTGCARGRRGAS
jgi:predicted RNA-binding protein YlxR (DUF448 family)